MIKSKKNISDKNIISCLIMSSDEDQPIIEDLYAGINTKGQLIISIEHTDYEDERYNCSTWAVVRNDETRRLARRLKVTRTELPDFIRECMSYMTYKVNPTFDDVRDCFKEITECLLDEGCRFRINRSCGRNGHTCC